MSTKTLLTRVAPPPLFGIRRSVHILERNLMTTKSFWPVPTFVQSSALSRFQSPTTELMRPTSGAKKPLFVNVSPAVCATSSGTWRVRLQNGIVLEGSEGLGPELLEALAAL